MKYRPRDNKELEKRAAIGVIRASRFIRKHARSRCKIDISTIKVIHRTIWRDAWFDIAGEYRGENLKITGSKLLLPHLIILKKSSH